MLLVALSVIVFLVGFPLLVFTLARRGRTLRIASALFAIGTGVGLEALVFVPAQNLPDVPVLGAAIELLLLATLPLSLLLMVLYPLALIGFGLFLLFRPLGPNPHAAPSKPQ